MSKRKGSYAELKAIEELQGWGYLCLKSGASLGPFDIVAIGENDIRLIQVKYGTARLSRAERKEIEEVKTPNNCTKEYWLKKKYKPWSITYL